MIHVLACIIIFHGFPVVQITTTEVASRAGNSTLMVLEARVRVESVSRQVGS